jgi:hypothetical protein
VEFCQESCSLGCKSDYQIDCKVGFGEYVQVYVEDTVKDTNTAGNFLGNYLFLNLATGEMIESRSFELPMSQEVINMLNERSIGGRGGAMRMDIDDIEDNVQHQHMEPHQETNIYSGKRDSYGFQQNIKEIKWSLSAYLLT